MALLPISVDNEDKILILAPHPDDECIGTGVIVLVSKSLRCCGND